MPKNSHLTLSDRISIEVALKEERSFKEIARMLNKDPTTISKEVRKHRRAIEKVSPHCTRQGACPIRTAAPNGRAKYTERRPCELSETCQSFTAVRCTKLSKPPYVCNGCKGFHGCRAEKSIYVAKEAHVEYELTRSESRKGIAVTPEELYRIDSIITPLIKKGQSLHQICSTNADVIMLDERTIYNYVDAGLLTVGNLDLPRKVRYKPRKKPKSARIDKQCHIGRTYDDFLEYMGANPDLPVVEMDSVMGKKGGKVLLTLFFRNCNLMLAFLRDANTARSVKEIFDSLYSILGYNTYRQLFPVILTDRGSEFSDPTSIECDENGEVRSRLFYCNPQRADQKGGCEVTHEFIRRILPKGSSFNDLSQEDILRMMSHINSYTRKKLGNQSAYQVFSFLYGDDILPRLGIQAIPSNAINLTPRLLK